MEEYPKYYNKCYDASLLNNISKRNAKDLILSNNILKRNHKDSSIFDYDFTSSKNNLKKFELKLGLSNKYDLRPPWEEKEENE